MRKHFDDQIAQLGEQMMAMGALVENTIERAIRALQTDDMAEAAAIRDGRPRCGRKRARGGSDVHPHAAPAAARRA